MLVRLLLLLLAVSVVAFIVSWVALVAPLPVAVSSVPLLLVVVEEFVAPPFDEFSVPTQEFWCNSVAIVAPVVLP